MRKLKTRWEKKGLLGRGKGEKEGSSLRVVTEKKEDPKRLIHKGEKKDLDNGASYIGGEGGGGSHSQRVGLGRKG